MSSELFSIKYNELMLKRHRASANTNSPEHQRLLALINSFDSAVIATDADGRVTLYNGSALELLDTNKELTGQLVGDLLKLVDQHHRSINLEERLPKLHEPLVTRDWLLKQTDGSLTNLELNITPIIAPAPAKPGGWVIVFSDITEQKSLEEERQDFISVISHELRTPVAIVEANLSTALLPNFVKIDAQARELITQAHNNVVFLGLLIRDLASLAKTERHDHPIEMETVNIPELMSEIETNYHPQATAKHLSFAVKVDEGVTDISSSKYVLTELLQNFISNALKYTEKGGLTVTATKEGQSLRLGVADTGIGISAKDKHHLFEKFFRAEDKRVTEIVGTGLGLYLTQKLAAQVGGTIGFTSQLGKGSNFWVELPLIPPPSHH